MKTVFKNARFFTGSSAAADHFDVIEHVGSYSGTQVATAEKDSAEVLDMNQRTLAPGFVDGHMHLLMFGSSLQKISLDHCKTLQDIQATIKNAAKQDKTLPRILCQE
ncbi:uncharacterized protein A1O9_12696 [Exophiala aquamarina CBS 119918]|uniref:Amidohydrolase 3 domain-containing protein n=1 Tax=Exophiala aquamarina CBS 119918 TaxID=1182545 RepID=A0A072NUR5_9EURO|nr:uncharacterized protein A1O9_12696 [Exophiala aquamarina CBS 119918]KEF51346.1 hypothetical protein A1O9_12696 [Exophiala aquamarina CBS 119918]